MPQDVSPVLGRGPGVQRHDDGTQSKKREHQHRHLEAVRGEDGNALPTLHAEVPVERAREGLHPRDELAAGQPALLELAAVEGERGAVPLLREARQQARYVERGGSRHGSFSSMNPYS